MRQTKHWGDQVPSPGTFWGALCFILNYGHFPNSTPVSEHFNQADHSTTNDVLLIPLYLIRSNRDYVRKARAAHLIDKAMTLEPRGINRRDEFS